MMKIKQKITMLIYQMFINLKHNPVAGGLLAGLTLKTLPYFLLSKLVRREFRYLILFFTLIL